VTTALLDLAAGVAQVGPVRLQVASAPPPGAVSVEGCALRPVTLGERTRVVALALAAPDPCQALADLVLDLAAIGPLPKDRVPAAAVALALAGAGTGVRLPDFWTVTAEAVRITGWAADAIEELPARDVDAIVAAEVVAHAGGAADTATQRILFVADEREAMAVVLADLADELLGRGALIAGAPLAASACDPVAAAIDPPRPPAAVPLLADSVLANGGGSVTAHPGRPAAQAAGRYGRPGARGGGPQDTPREMSHEGNEGPSFSPGRRAAPDETIPGPRARPAASDMAARSRQRVTATVVDPCRGPAGLLAELPRGGAAGPRPGPAARRAALLAGARSTPATLRTCSRGADATGTGAAAAAREAAWLRYRPSMAPGAPDVAPGAAGPGAACYAPGPGDPSTQAHQAADLERLADALGALLAGECDLRGLAP
jgi:hypothetical protein